MGCLNFRINLVQYEKYFPKFMYCISNFESLVFELLSNVRSKDKVIIHGVGQTTLMSMEHEANG